MQIKGMDQDRVFNFRKFHAPYNRNFLSDVGNATTPEELHAACWGYVAPSDWKGRPWLLIMGQDDPDICDRIPDTLELLGIWGRPRNRHTGEQYLGAVVMVRFPKCVDPGVAWQFAMGMKVPVMVPCKEGVRVLPPNTDASQIYPSVLAGMLEGFDVVLCPCWGINMIERMGLQASPRIPNFPKTLEEENSSFQVKGRDFRFHP